MRSRRAWIYVLSVAALLVPAVGIAYLGAVSYRDERGAVSAQNARQREAALALVSRIDRAIELTLAAAERSIEVDAVGGAPWPADEGLGRYWFWIDAERRLRVPRAAPPPELSGGLPRGGCPGLPVDECARETEQRSAHMTRLRAAQRAEAQASWPEARRLYASLEKFDNTGPAAMLGLARVVDRMGEPARASQILGELERRFSDRTIDLVPVQLVVAVLRAEVAGPAGPAALLDVAEGILAGKYALDPILRLGAVLRIRQRLDDPLPPELARRRAVLDEQVAVVRREARAAVALAEDLDELARSAAPAWRGRPATRDRQRTLVYRRRADGGVVGIAVDGPMLEAAAGAPAEDLAQHAQAVVLVTGAVPGAELRTIAQVPLGAALPHLSLAIVNPVRDPDPLDEVIRERSRKHVAYTSGLALLLGLGLLATIRGAARARELARLKSDFVSTVSHELKTPLTSIRMFAEMLEHGVARNDTEKMARYQRVIVQESQRLGLLIANLLDYAQIEKGTRRYTPSRQDIAGLARHAVATFETLRHPEGVRNSIEVTVAPGAASAEVEVDRDVVVQALLNLLANAAKYGGTEHPIEVTVGADEAAAWISVRDHGPGIPPSEQARIFREFYRAPEAYRSNVEGTGLGLALVKQHIEALGGTVEVASAVGQGATFTIRLARAAQEGP
ncbi:MAG TPA: HAMP domain-containing sensor histidine kinase [Kofleriaceae bacterium]|nr:HAMP domain-containing sensor histidine kinase [Kofleriaceae bacterium]